MAEGDTFGTGLMFNTGDPATGAASNFGDVGAGSDAGPSEAPAAVTGSGPSGSANPPTARQPATSFGSGLSLGGPRYVPPDPKTSELDQSAALLQQRIQRAGSVATNPLAQFFNPEAVQKARDFVPAATEQLRQIQQQRQQQTDIQKQALNYGVPKEQISPYMTGDTIDNYLLDRYKSGDFSVANALKARGKGEWLQDFAGQALDGAQQRLTSADTAINKLTAAGSSQEAYAAARRSMTPEDRQALAGMGLQDVPEKASDWQGLVQKHGAQFAQAKQMQMQLQTKFNNMTNFDGAPTKEVQEASQGDMKLGSSNETAGFPVRTRGMDGQLGHVGPSGSVSMEKYGMSTKDGGWNAWSKERQKAFQEQTADPLVKGAVNQYSIANKFKHEAFDEKNYTSSAGLALLKDTLGGVGRDVAETSAAAGTVGLTKMMTQQQGGFEGWANRAQNELGAIKNWLDGGKKGPEPRISADTKRGLQLVAETNYQYSLDEAKGRLGGAMTLAGQGGLPLDQIPLDKDLKGELADMHESGRRDAINGWMSHPSLTRGDQRVFFTQGANVPGAQPPRAATQQAPPTSAPSPSGGTPPASPNPTAPSPTGSGPAGGGTPVMIAGQSVTPPALPQGASPQYLTKMQRIESGNEKDPWTSGTPQSSASGAFQFINSTWAADKPPGAPARAADATPQQQTEAAATRATKNAAALTRAGVPVNDTNLYIAHNLGEGAGPKLLNADPNADAREIVGEAAARNNPLFFRGRPTVATVLQRYDAEMNKGAAPTSATTAAGAQAAPASTFDTRLKQLMPGLRPSQPAKDLATNAVDYAPAIGSTAGAAVGSAGGPLGTVGGGAAGAAAGQSFKDWMQGRDQNPAAIAKEAALGGVLGLVPARPLVGAAVRAVGVGGVEAGAEAAQGGSAGDIIEAGAKGVGFALGGEALGRFVSSAGATAYKALSRYTTTAQAELSASAGKLAEARKTMETEQPKLPGAGGTDTANPKYEAAKKAADDATAAIKDHGQNPDDMVHAYEQAKAGVSSGEAAVTRKAASEKADVSAGYNQLRKDVNEAGVGAVKANQPLADGPVSMLRTAPKNPLSGDLNSPTDLAERLALMRKRPGAYGSEVAGNPTGTVEEKFRADAEHAEMLATAPAKSWGDKWQQLQNAGSELIQKRMSFLANNDKPSADAMDQLFQGVRKQQEKAAEYVFGPAKGKQVIAQLENLDTRYAKVMNATQGMNYEKMRGVLAQGNTPAARDLEKNFREFAKDDPSAIRAFNAMKAGARGDWKSEAALMGPVIMGEVAANLHGIPTVGAISALVGGQRLYKLVQGYMNAKLLGKAVMFKDFLAQEIKAPTAVNAAQRAVVHGEISLNPIGSANASSIQMRPIGNGQVQVINIRTGQVIYTGSAAGAANAQASGAAQQRRILD